MILAIDSLAERYGRLPHEILHEASTFDLYVLNSSIEYRNRQQDLAMAGVDKNVPHLSQEEMKKMIESVRSGA
jgi:hypothetical protein